MTYLTPLYLTAIVFLNVIGCRKEPPNPCLGVTCTDTTVALFKFRLVKPGTNTDLVFGPNASIPQDSIKIYDSVMIHPRIDTVNGAYNFSTPYFPYYTIYIGYKKTILEVLGTKDCCHFEIEAANIYDYPRQSLTRDSNGVYLVPLSL